MKELKECCGDQCGFQCPQKGFHFCCSAVAEGEKLKFNPVLQEVVSYFLLSIFEDVNC